MAKRKKTARLHYKMPKTGRNKGKLCAYRGKKKLGCATKKGSRKQQRARLSKKFGKTTKTAWKHKKKGGKKRKSYHKKKKGHRKSAWRVAAGKKAWQTRLRKAKQGAADDIWEAIKHGDPAHPPYVPGEEAVYGLGSWHRRRRKHRR